MYIGTDYFSNVIHSSEQTNKKKRRDELRDVLARMKQMDELFKRTEKEHLETIAAMQKRIKELEGTFSNIDDRKPSAFIVSTLVLSFFTSASCFHFSFSVFGTCDTKFALVVAIKSQES